MPARGFTGGVGYRAGWVQGPHEDVFLQAVPAGRRSDSCLLPEVLIICHARLWGVVCEQHAYDGLVFGKLQGSYRIDNIVLLWSPF